MSENGADVSWNDVGKVLEDERSSVEDIQTDLARNNKGNICQSIDNCMTVFQRDPLLKGAIRKNELSGKIDIVGNLGWERTSSSLTDTDVYQLHWYLEKEYGLKVSLNSTDPVLMEDKRYRRFTPREVARIQSFPDDFELVGSEAAQYRALGNAIPPVMFWYVAKAVSGKLQENING